MVARSADYIYSGEGAAIWNDKDNKYLKHDSSDNIQKFSASESGASVYKLHFRAANSKWYIIHDLSDKLLRCNPGNKRIYKHNKTFSQAWNDSKCAWSISKKEGGNFDFFHLRNRYRESVSSQYSILAVSQNDNHSRADGNRNSDLVDWRGTKNKPEGIRLYRRSLSGSGVFTHNGQIVDEDPTNNYKADGLRQ